MGTSRRRHAFARGPSCRTWWPPCRRRCPDIQLRILRMLENEMLTYGLANLIRFYLALLGLGVVWSPFAGLTCGLIAKSRGAATRNYVIAGAMYSALLFLPWVYFVARMCNRRIPIYAVGGSYILVYSLWSTVIVFHAAFASETPTAPTPLVAGTLLYGALIMNVSMFIISLWQLVYRQVLWMGLMKKGLQYIKLLGAIGHRKGKLLDYVERPYARVDRTEERNDARLDMIGYVYLMPFACGTGWLIAMPVLWIILLFIYRS